VILTLKTGLSPSLIKVVVAALPTLPEVLDSFS
jgi:hypothetical protein